jgi:type II secretory pathway pseudopilin PulG
MSGGNQNADRYRTKYGGACEEKVGKKMVKSKRPAQEQQQQKQQQQQQQQHQQHQQQQQQRKKILYNWEIAEDDTGQFVIGLLMEDNEQKDWETNYLTKIVLHRLYLEGFTDSGSIYVMEYKHAKPGGHTVYTFVGDN